MNISVIIPVFNTEKLLPRCLDSLKRQKLRDIEFICVDDGSTDSSLDICNSYAKIDDRFKVYSQKNSGPAKARNLGLSKSIGDYICFVDSDDYLEESALSRMYSLITSGDYDLLIHGANVISNGNKVDSWINETVTIKNKKISKFTPDLIFTTNGCRPFLWLHLIKSKIIRDNNLWMNCNLVIGEDQAFEISYLQYVHKVILIEDKLYNYNISQNSIMGHFHDKLSEKISQHIEMVRSVLETLSKQIGNKKLDVRLIHWVIEVFYWDLIKLLYRDQIVFLKSILPMLEQLNILSHLNDLCIFDIAAFRQFNIVYNNANEPPKMIAELNELNELYANALQKTHDSKLYALYKKIFS